MVHLLLPILQAKICFVLPRFADIAQATKGLFPMLDVVCN